MNTADATKITPSRRRQIIAALMSGRTDVHAGNITLTEFHKNVDATSELFARAGADAVPAHLRSWGR